MPLPPRTIVADRGDAGRRVDLVVRRHLTDLDRATRTRVQAWIEAGRVSINGLVVKRVAARAALGDIIIVELPDETARAPVLAEDGPVERLFEDEHLLIVNKPAGVVSHPTYLHPAGSLLNRVLGYARDWPPGTRPSLVGRLDKHTSGIVIVAKTTEAHARMQRTLTSSFSEKTYLAVVYGAVPGMPGQIDFRLRRHPDDRRRVVASSDHGLASLTRYALLDTAMHGQTAVSVVRCGLVTGRMHQIRVHLTASGWPLVGDAKYGEPRWESMPEGSVARAACEAFHRQALHAWQVSFAHPYTGERVRVTAPVPSDMRRLLDACGLAIYATH